MRGNLTRRVENLEGSKSGLQQTMTAIWGGPQDDAALASARAEAERTGRLLVIIRQFSHTEAHP